MKDSEVGELWRLYSEACPEHLHMFKLIRKLVEERAALLQHAIGENEIGDCEREALRVFGIDPESWK